MKKLALLLSLFILGHSVELRAQEPLKDLARRHGLLIGSQVRPKVFRKDLTYRKMFLREFALAIPGNDFKMPVLKPKPDWYRFQHTDAIVNEAMQHGIVLHGHALIYEVPWYIEKRRWTRRELIAYIEDYIHTVVTRYRGRIAAWDVVNEAFCIKQAEPCILDPGSDAGMDPTIWRKVIGPEFVEIALRAARKADPNAFLYINDNHYGLIESVKGNKIYEFVMDLKARNVPIDGVGLQMHLRLDKIDSFELAEAKKSIAANFKRFNELGLDVHVTELDVAIPKGQGGPTKKQLADQAKAFATALEVCLEAAKCSTFNIWGFTDKYSWMRRHSKRYDHGTITDYNLVPKPAFRAIRQVLRNHSK